MCLWDGQAGAAGLSGARQSGKGWKSIHPSGKNDALWNGSDSGVCFVVREGAHHHDSLQLHQTGEGPALPGPDERQGGHSVVHRAGEVSLLFILTYGALSRRDVGLNDGTRSSFTSEDLISISL